METTVTMKLTKTTRRTFRYDAEETPGAPPPHVSNIYVDQAAFAYKAPKKVTVTVTAGEEV
jgi:hypothetical protein